MIASDLTIPLTKECLLHFGFEYDNTKGGYIKKEEIANFLVKEQQFTDGTYGFLASVNLNTGTNVYPLTGLDVRQLQNLYHAVTGHNLTVNELA